ncbi:MAG TPA: hypothetical protein PKI59_08340 [Candidatus Cloacimonadota bacterium]|jgi:hypothetical protein|nr:hypothetical protein [Candidatus Cloacimonadota bacterium]
MKYESHSYFNRNAKAMQAGNFKAADKMAGHLIRLVIIGADL